MAVPNKMEHAKIRWPLHIAQMQFSGFESPKPAVTTR